KLFRLDSADFRGERQRGPGHLEAVPIPVECHFGARIKLPVRMTSTRECEGQGHGEAGSMRRSDELLRVGAGPVLEARRKTIGFAVERAAFRPDVPFAVLAEAF